MRVPEDQSGAAAAARWIARSGERVASARVMRVRRVANTNASASRPAHVRNWRYAGAFGAAGAARRRRELDPRHQLVEQRQLARVERVEALAAQALLVAGGDGY